MSRTYPSVFKSNLSGHIFQALISGCVFSVSLWMLIISIDFDRIPKVLVNTVLISITVLSFIILLVSILRFIKPLPELEYLERGFSFKVGTSTLIHVNWEDVEDLAFVSVENEQVLAVMLKRPSLAIRPLRGWASVVMKVRLKKYGTPVILSARRLHVNLDDLKVGFVHHWNKYRH